MAVVQPGLSSCSPTPQLMRSTLLQLDRLSVCSCGLPLLSSLGPPRALEKSCKGRNCLAGCHYLRPVASMPFSPALGTLISRVPISFRPTLWPKPRCQWKQAKPRSWRAAQRSWRSAGPSGVDFKPATRPDAKGRCAVNVFQAKGGSAVLGRLRAQRPEVLLRIVTAAGSCFDRQQAPGEPPRPDAGLKQLMFLDRADTPRTEINGTPAGRDLRYSRPEAKPKSKRGPPSTGLGTSSAASSQGMASVVRICLNPYGRHGVPAGGTHWRKPQPPCL